MKGVRIGVVCEGPTDFITIRALIGEALSKERFDVTFIQLQPNPDNTRANPEGGWGNVEKWLINNPLDRRMKRYIHEGLFADELDALRCDIFLIQLDGDNLDDTKSFRTRVSSCIHGLPINTPRERFTAISKIIESWASLENATGSDLERHVCAPSIESIETWCIAAHRNLNTDVDTLTMPKLAEEFGITINIVESRTVKLASTKINKNQNRRERLCKALKTDECVKRSRKQSYSFNQVVENSLKAVNKL